VRKKYTKRIAVVTLISQICLFLLLIGLLVVNHLLVDCSDPELNPLPVCDSPGKPLVFGGFLIVIGGIILAATAEIIMLLVTTVSRRPTQIGIEKEEYRSAQANERM
jgi:hypothetical protein